MSIVVIISWSVLKKDYWFLVKHLSVCLVTLHILKERYMVFDFALSIHNIMRFTDIWKKIDFPMVVLESNLILFGWVHAVRIVRSRRCLVLSLFMFRRLRLIHLNLKR